MCSQYGVISNLKESILLQLQGDMAMPKSLVTIFLDDKEISKKIFQLESVEEIVDDCKSNATLLLNSELLECDRILKFSPEFNEFIDIDCHDLVPHMDKFQVFFKTREASMLVCIFAMIIL